MEYETIQDYEKAGFEGGDASLDISLFEYGLIWKEEKPDKLKFVYAIGYDDTGNANRFTDDLYTRNELRKMFQENWFDLRKFEDFIGEEANFTFPELEVQSMLQYYGIENIFGTISTEGYQITRGETATTRLDLKVELDILRKQIKTLEARYTELNNVYYSDKWKEKD